MAGISMSQGVRNALRFSQDFQWDAAKALMLGINPYTVSLSGSGRPDPGEVRGGEGLEEFYQSFDDIGAPQRMEANQFPSLLFLLAPMALLPWKTARVLWLQLNLLFTAGILILLRKLFFHQWEKSEYLFLVMFLIAGTPWRNQIGVGQHTLFSLFFFLLAVAADEAGMEADRREKRVLFGFLSALFLAVSWFKYTLTAPLTLLFLYRRRWGTILLPFFLHLAGTFAAARWLGTSFADMIRQPLQVSSALAGEGSIDIGALFQGAGWTMILTAAVMLLLAAAAPVLPGGLDTEFFSFALLISLIVTYHRSYDFFVLAAAAAGVLLLDSGREGEILRYAYHALLLYLFFGLRLFSENRFSLILAGLFYYSFTILYACLLFRKCRETGRAVSRGS